MDTNFDKDAGIIDRAINSFPGNFEHVATLKLADGTNEEEALITAFLTTNNIDSSWVGNAEVTWSRGERRSTSVGDLVEIDGQFHICLPTSWRKIDIPLVVIGQ